MTATVTISVFAFVMSLFAMMVVGYLLAAHDKRAARPDEWHVHDTGRSVAVRRRTVRGSTTAASQYETAVRLEFDPEDDDARAAALARAEAVLFAVRDTERRARELSRPPR